MGELQLDSRVLVPLQMEGEPQEAGQLPAEIIDRVTGLITDHLDDNPAAPDTDTSVAYSGPELVLPELRETPLAEQPLFTKTTTITAEDITTDWRDRVSLYARRTAAIATLGGVLASAACSGQVDGQGSAQPGGAPSHSHSTAAPTPSASVSAPATSAQREPKPSLSSVLYPCTFTGRTEIPSNDARVRSGTSIDERAVAQLLDTNPADIAKCDAPRVVDGVPQDPAIVTGVEYQQKSTGTRVVALVFTDKVNADTGRPSAIDNYLTNPNEAIDMGYNNYTGAFTCAPAVDDLTRIAECDGLLTTPKDAAKSTFYVFSLAVMEDAHNRHGLGRVGTSIGETAGNKVSKTNSLLGANMPLTIGPPTAG